MINNNGGLFLIFSIFAIVLGVCGFYCIMVTRNFIRSLIGLEILTKAVTLLIIAAGYASNRIALAQSMVITLIVIEAVVISVAAGIVFGIFKQIGSLNITKLRNLKG
ncbi:MAG: NADH-quinone oxidoreductase subunit K [bacterium]